MCFQVLWAGGREKGHGSGSGSGRVASACGKGESREVVLLKRCARESLSTKNHKIWS